MFSVLNFYKEQSNKESYADLPDAAGTRVSDTNASKRVIVVIYSDFVILSIDNLLKQKGWADDPLLNFRNLPSSGQKTPVLYQLNNIMQMMGGKILQSASFYIR